MGFALWEFESPLSGNAYPLAPLQPDFQRGDSGRGVGSTSPIPGDLAEGGPRVDPGISGRGPKTGKVLVRKGGSNSARYGGMWPLPKAVVGRWWRTATRRVRRDAAREAREQPPQGEPHKILSLAVSLLITIVYSTEQHSTTRT